VAVKKTAKKTAKKSAKKVTAKRAVKKSAAKKVTKKAVKKVTKKAVKKVAKKSAKPARSVKRTTSTFIVPPVPTSAIRPGVKSITTTPTPAASKSTAVKSAPAQSTAVKSAPAQKSSNRLVLTVLAGIVVLALVVVSRNSSSTKNTTAEPTPAASSAASTPEASAPASEPASPSAPSAGHFEPVGIVAHYTATGATIFWAAPSDATGIANYNVEIRPNGGTWKLITTVPASQLSLDITKGDSTGWCSFRVSTVYSDSTVVGGKVFGLPGQYA
jgi:glucan-binding YG repeat protein